MDPNEKSKFSLNKIFILGKKKFLHSSSFLCLHTLSSISPISYKMKCLRYKNIELDHPLPTKDGSLTSRVLWTVDFNDMHNMQGCEDQLPNAMWYFEIFMHEHETISPII